MWADGDQLLESTMRELEGTFDPEKQAYLCRRSWPLLHFTLFIVFSSSSHLVSWFTFLNEHWSALLSGLQLKLLLGSNLVQSILLLESRSWKSISGTPIGLSLMSACSPCSKSTLPSFSLVDDQNGLNNYAEAILTEQDRFKNHSKDWESSLSIDHPSIQVVSSVVKYYKVSYI